MNERFTPHNQEDWLPLSAEQAHETRRTPFPDRLRPPTEEMVELYGMLRESSAINGPVAIRPVTLSTENGEVNVGYEIRLFQNRENFSGASGNDWVLYDLDDSLSAYSSAKGPRQASYNAYLQANGLGFIDDGPQNKRGILTRMTLRQKNLCWQTYTRL